MRAVLLAGLAALAAGTAAAQPAPPSGSAQPQVPPVAQQCVGCHGARGQGIAAAGYPRIAAQSGYYLAKQLRDYASGRRRHPAMEPIARALPEGDIDTLATYYSRLEAPARQTPPGPERGRVLATVGDAGRGVQACANCHGPGGIGEPPAIPYLAGLDAQYQATAINAWKAGTRRNDAGDQMRTVANALSAEDVAAVSAYYAGLQPPPPQPAQVTLVRPRLRADPTPTAGPASEPDEAGAEQGMPSGGGTHGEGATDTQPESSSTTAPAAGTGTGRTPATPRLGAAPVGDPARGRTLVASGQHGCPACHAIPGIRWPRGVVGPPLEGMASRALIAGALPNDIDTLTAFLRDPPALLPATGMPAVGLSEQDARDVAAYLYSLGGGNGR